MATGIECISTKTVLSKLATLNAIVVKRARTGKATILRRLNLNALTLSVYFLPYKKTPSKKMATGAVVLPNMCREVDTGDGISMPMRDNKTPAMIDIINGFFESLLITRFNPFHIVDFSSLYNSKTMIETVTPTTEMKAADNVARCSPSVVGKANIIKGMPKKVKLPKTVLRISR